MQRKVTKLCTHIRDIIPDRSTVLDFLLDGATFRVRSTFHTCYLSIAEVRAALNAVTFFTEHILLAETHVGSVSKRSGFKSER